MKISGKEIVCEARMFFFAIFIPSISCKVNLALTSSMVFYLPYLLQGLYPYYHIFPSPLPLPSFPFPKVQPFFRAAGGPVDIEACFASRSVEATTIKVTVRCN